MLYLPERSLTTLDTVHCINALTLLRGLPDNFVHCVVTSPPYFGLRDYGVSGQVGLESTPQAFVQRLVEIFREVRRVLRKDGTCWLNLGDSYVSNGDQSPAGSTKQASNRGANAAGRNIKLSLPDKNLLMIPARVAIGLQDDGWILRSDIIWNKPNPMPESVTDRPTKSHEYVYLLVKSQRYHYDADAIKEDAVESDREYSFTTPYKIIGRAGGNPSGNEANGKMLSYAKRNKRSVWEVGTEPNSFAHFATFPQKLIEPMILAGCPKDGIVLDPFMGSGTTGLVARKLGRHYIGSELNPEYVAIAKDRLRLPFEPRQVKHKNDVSDLPMFASMV